MPEETFVIVGSDGTEHEFPVGMDPKRAAAIVRGEKPPTTPPQPESRRPTIYNQPVGQSLLDIGKGALGQAWETAKSVGMAMEDPAGSLLKLLASQPKELYDIHAKGEEARHQGRTSEAIGYHAAGMLPIIGPGIVAAAENIGSAEPERVGRGFIDTANVGLGSRAVIPSVQTAAPAAAAAARLPLTGANRLFTGAQEFAAANPAVPPLVGGAVGYATGGWPGAAYGLGLGSTPGILRTVREILSPKTTTADVAPGITASQLPRVSPPARGPLRGPEPRPTVAPPPLGTLRGPEARPTVAPPPLGTLRGPEPRPSVPPPALGPLRGPEPRPNVPPPALGTLRGPEARPAVAPPPLGTLRGPTGAPMPGPGVPTSQSPPVRPPGRGKLRSYGDEEPSPTTGPGVPTSEHKKVRPPAQRERTIEEEVSERTKPPSEPARREVEKQLAEEAKTKTTPPPQGVAPTKSKRANYTENDLKALKEKWGSADVSDLIEQHGLDAVKKVIDEGRAKRSAQYYSEAKAAKAAREKK